MFINEKRSGFLSRTSFFIEDTFFVVFGKMGNGHMIPAMIALSISSVLGRTGPLNDGLNKIDCDNPIRKMGSVDWWSGGGWVDVSTCSKPVTLVISKKADYVSEDDKGMLEGRVNTTYPIW